MATKNSRDIDAALKLKAQGKSAAVVVAAGPVPVKAMAAEVLVNMAEGLDGGSVPSC